MNKAFEALAEVRRWLCDNLSDRDAGKVCGMLSVVSRRICELEEENAKLNDFNETIIKEMDVVNAKRWKLVKDNAKLRELCADMMQFFEDGDYCTTCEKAAECDASEIYECDCLMHHVFKDRMRELGVEA